MITMLPGQRGNKDGHKKYFATETYSLLFILAIPHEIHYFMVALVYNFNTYLNTATCIHFTFMYHDNLSLMYPHVAAPWGISS